MNIEVRLLGPVELRVDGNPVYAGPAKRRAVLAALALDANRPVPLDRLTEMLWSERPPRSAIANIRNHVAALRRTVGSRLVSRPGAYQLTLGPGELDAADFRQLSETGHDALVRGVPGRAEPSLAAALRLWRGPAGQGLPRGPALDAPLAGLEAERLRVVEDLVRARLQLGYAGELVPMLREHLAAHPLREQAWAQLMLALYRAGDLGGALSAYREARATLHAQLGIDPGAELAELHVAMLARSPRLDLPMRARGTAALSAGAEVPRELPPDPPFVPAHSDELAAVLAAVNPSGRERTHPAAVVYGPPGSGKSSLITRAGHRLADAFPDGQIFITRAGPEVSAADLMARVLRALGIPPNEVPEQADERLGRYRSLLAARRVLVVVDGATEAGQVWPLIPGSRGSVLLITSREPLRLPRGVPQVPLHPLRSGAATSR